jgi:hypothetical protein
MSEQKPKKDLRARLGRTISPNTPGAAPINAPAGVIAPPAAAPSPAAPTASAPAATPGAAPAIAAPAIAPPIAAPAKLPFGNDIVAPPFARPAEPAKPEPRKRSADPFAAGPATAGEVRLVIEEKPTQDPSTTAGARGRTAVIVGVGLALGMVLGAGAGTVNGEHNLYNIGVRDGHDVAETFQHASEVVTEAQGHLDAIVTAARGGADHHPTINYDEIAALHALENPLHQGAFARKSYARFEHGTVDDLFVFQANVATLWDDFTRISNITTGPARRATLEAAAQATTCPADLGHDEASATAAIQAAAQGTTDGANAQYVALLQTTDDGTVQGTLGFAEQDLDTTSHQPTGRLFMRAARTGPGRAFDRWTPGATINGTPSGVLEIDGPGSAAVLGDRVGAFRSFAQALEETRTLMLQTAEVQQRLSTALTGIANLPEQFAL